MKQTVQKLQVFAAAREFAPLLDERTPEVDAVLEAFRESKVRVTLQDPGNDLYSHLIECHFDSDLRAGFFIRFDLRVFVVVFYAKHGRAWDTLADHAKLRVLCAPFLKILEARNFERITLDEASHAFPEEMLDQGFVDNTLLAYFFESL